jgi:hypothetical protein
MMMMTLVSGMWLPSSQFNLRLQLLGLWRLRRLCRRGLWLCWRKLLVG